MKRESKEGSCLGKWIKRVLAVLLLCAMVLCYARWIEPRWIQVKKVELSLPGLTEEMRVVCFGDTHMGLEFGPEDLEKWVEKINRQEPQVVVFLGDLFDNYSQYEGDPGEVSRVLSQLQAPCKLAVMGNHDVGGGAERVYEDIMEKAGFQVLRNQNVQLGSVNFVGADELLFFVPQVEGLEEEGKCNILLSHAPDYADETQGFQLSVAGHTHGGQVCWPFYGALVKPPGGEHYTAGLYEEGDELVYVNRGLGVTSLPLRFFARPEITVLELSPQGG